MKIVEKMLVRQAIELTAIIGEKTESLEQQAMSFLKTELGLEVSKEDFDSVLDYELCSRLFYEYGKSNPGAIKKPQRMIRIARDLWLDYKIGTAKLLNMETIYSQVSEKHEKEE